MDTVVKPVDVIHGSPLNHHGFVGLWEGTESEHNDTTYLTRWLSRGYVLQRSSDLLNEIKFITRTNKNIEELNGELWISDPAFLMDATYHFNSLNM
jgi:hypothetical protein